MEISSGAPRYAGFWIRFLADIIDSTLLTFVSWFLELICLGAFYWIQVLFHFREGSGFWSAYNPFFIQILNIGFYGVVAFPYYVWGHYRYGTTVGKKPFHIYVVQNGDLSPLTSKQSVVRCLAYVISYLPFSAGFSMAAFHPQKRALHDLIAGTVSIRRVATAAMILISIFTLASSGAPSLARASEVTPVLAASMLSAPSLGGELTAALMIPAIEEHGWVAGPRLNLIGLSSSSTSASRFEAAIGGETVLWMLNAFGPGIAVDAIAPTTAQQGVGFRVEPSLTTRFAKYGEQGAWAIRLGAPWDSRFSWGIKVGLSLQFSNAAGRIPLDFLTP